MALGRNGGDTSEDDAEASEGAGVKDARLISRSRIDSKDAEESQGGGRMLARCWRLRRSASHRGRVARLGGRRGGIGPYEDLFRLELFKRKGFDDYNAENVGWYLFLQGMLGLWGATHPEQLEFVQSLAGNDGHHLHLANKSDFGRRQTGWKR